MNDDNLRLSLSLSSQFHQRRLSNDSSSGAGANAAAATSTAVEMAFVAATDPLSELVWSPHNGLLLKCAGSRLISQRTYLFGKDSKKTMSGNSLNHTSQVGESSRRPNEGKEFHSGDFEAPVLDIIGVLDDGKQKEECLLNVSKMKGSDRTHGTGDVGGNDQKHYQEDELDSETNVDKRKQCKASDTAANACPKSSGRKDDSSHDKNISVGQSPTSSRIQRYRRKGKEKALSGGDLNTNPSPMNNDGDSHESVESCNSIGLFSKGKKIWDGDDQQQLSNNESKRRKQNHDSLGSTSFVRPESSFVCWISNMMKAFPKPNQEDTAAPLALTLAQSSENQIIAPKKAPDPEVKNTGFQNMFKLICSRDTKAREEMCISDNGVCDVNATPLACFGPNNQLLLTKEQCDQSTTPKSGADLSAKSKDGEILRTLGSGTKKNGVSPACSSLGKRKATTDNSNDCIRRSDPMESLWITRFSHKSSGPSPVTKPHFLEQERKLEAGVNSSENPVKSSEAMSSVFARRLDALKHVLPSDTTRLTTCLFCGEKGHDLKDCLEITDIELDDLVKNVHSHDGAEDSPRLCIKCFQLSHWAVSCPSVSSKRKKFEELGSPISQSKVGRNNPAEKPIQLNNLAISSIQAIGQKDNPNGSSIYMFVNDQQISVVPKGFFDAIKRLRLSRTNILKWRNSQIPLSRLDGFYLRLRLGKWEEGLGGAGYYVGRVNGALDESLPKGSKNAIPVNIGGMKCLVESQYVSNHDFLEDELEAWWSLMFKSGGNIPSEGDLKQKVEERKKLGF